MCLCILRKNQTKIAVFQSQSVPFGSKNNIDLFNVSPNKVMVVYNGLDSKFKVLDRAAHGILKSKYNIDFNYIL